MSDVYALERTQASKSWSRRLSQRLRPLIDFVEQYTMAVDISVQGAPSPAAVVWGTLRALLKVASAFSTYFEALLLKVVEIGDIVSIYAQYDGFLGHDERFRRAVTHAYLEIVRFLDTVRKIFSRPGQFVSKEPRVNWASILTVAGIRVFTKAILRDFESEFQHTSGALLRRINILKNEATLASRTEVHSLLRTQKLQADALIDHTKDLAHQHNASTST